MEILKYILILLMITITSAFAGNKPRATVSGFIYQDSNGEALIGANVYFDEVPIGSSTNNGGYYVIPHIPDGKYTLVVDFLGYKPHKQKIFIKDGDNKKINVRLKEDLLQTEAIIVVADSVRTIEKLYYKSISHVNLSAKQIKHIPQVAEADLLRSLQTLPGVLPLSDYSSALYIRGGTPDQNLYMIDGTDVYNPEHAFGLFSTFNTDAIKQIELSKGGFGAEYGGRLSSILNVTNLDGNLEQFEGSASISLLSAKTTIQVPINNKGSVSGSIRRTYFDKTIAKSVDEIPDYYFYDGNIKGFYNLDDKNKLTVSVFSGLDNLNFIFNENATDETGFNLNWGNKTGSLKWTKVFNPRLYSNFWITTSNFDSEFDLSALKILEKNKIKDLTIKGNLEFAFSNSFRTNFGFEQKNIHASYKEDAPGFGINVSTDPKHYIGYVQSNWKPLPRFEIDAGLRYNLFNSDTTYQNLAPRFSMKYRLSDKINLRAATGVYYQYMHRIPRFFMTSIWSVSNKYQQESSSRHFILGYQQEINKDYQLEAEVFHKEYNDIYSFNQNLVVEIDPEDYNDKEEPIYKNTKGIFNSVDGYSTGFEILLRKDIGRVNGWIGYSYTKTRYKADNINQGKYYSPRHDRTSTLNVVTNFDLTKTRGKWKLGFNFVYSTGQPFTEPGSGYIIGSSPSSPNRYVEYYPTKINNIRFPAYARLDVSLTYKKEFKNWTLIPYLQIYNFGNRKNVWFVNYNYENGVPEIKENYMFPILPTAGVNIKF